MMKYREEADYNPSYMFAREDFINLTKESEVLAGKIKDYPYNAAYIGKGHIICYNNGRNIH